MGKRVRRAWELREIRTRISFADLAVQKSSLTLAGAGDTGAARLESPP